MEAKDTVKMGRVETVNPVSRAIDSYSVRVSLVRLEQPQLQLRSTVTEWQ